MKKFNIVLFLLLCIALAGLLFLRWKAREETPVPVIAETAAPAPSPTATPETNARADALPCPDAGADRLRAAQGLHRGEL